MDEESVLNEGAQLLLSEDITHQSEDIRIEINKSNEDLTHNMEQEDILNTSMRSQKRTREEDGEETWVEVRNRRERLKEIRGTIEICVTAKVTFPKQFALAKLFREHKILNITKVKYINPYKISVECKDEDSAKELIKCQKLLDLGWKFQRPFEVGLSYGVIKNIELELSEQELLQSITAPNCEVVSVKRLKRRTLGETGWTESESVRVAFKGSLLPTYICIFDMKVRVAPYLFPVTQCSRCWRYGHTQTMCPSKRVYCPKCGGKHGNCEITTFKCINCTNDHMALNRSCPAYIKEKKIREIMSENNVSYRKAMSMYLPPEPPLRRTTSRSTNLLEPVLVPIITPSEPRYFDSTLPAPETSTYANVASTSRSTYKDSHRLPEENMTQKNVSKEKKKKKRKEAQIPLEEYNLTEIDSQHGTDSEKCNESEEGNQRSRHRRDDLTFNQLLTKLKNIIFLGSSSLKEKIQNAMQICMEWFISWVFNNIPNLPLLRTLFS